MNFMKIRPKKNLSYHFNPNFQSSPNRVSRMLLLLSDSILRNVWMVLWHIASERARAQCVVKVLACNLQPGQLFKGFRQCYALASKYFSIKI